MNHVVTTLATVMLSTLNLSAEIFGGIEFPQGAASFADELVAYQPAHSGGAVPTDPKFTDPTRALGIPDYSGGDSGTGSVSLGSGGRVTLKFTNNRLTGSNSTAPDLHIFEVGPEVEDTFVEISKDGTIWHSVGKVFGATSSIDIDAYGFTSSDCFAFVRLTDDRNEGATTGPKVGADIDAVGVLSGIVTLPSIGISVVSSTVSLSFSNLVPGRSYRIMKSYALSGWTLASQFTSASATGTWSEALVSEGRRFYRLEWDG